MFQRLWNDLENLDELEDSVAAIQNFLFSIPSAPKREGQQQVLKPARANRSFATIKQIVDCGFRPSYLTHSPIMEYFKSDGNAAAIMHI